MLTTSEDVYVSVCEQPAHGDILRLLDMLPCMAFVEQDNRITAQNDAAVAQTGLDPQINVAVERVFLGAFPDSGTSAGFDCVLLRQSGRPLVVQGAARMLVDGSRLIVAMEKRSAEDPGEGSFLRDLLDSAPEAMAITHERRLLHVNREFVRLFGHPAEECIGRDIDELLLPDGREHENEMLFHMLAVEARGSIETVRLARSGEMVDVSLLMAPVRLSGSTMGMFHTFRDIRAQKLQEARLHHDAMHDGLTGLANRALFMDRLRLTLARLKRRPERYFAVMFLDLDKFKSVNDALGHAAGDTLLLEISRRLRDSVRPQDTVARFGGDEFAVLLDEAGKPSDVARVAERIQAAAARPVPFDGTSLNVPVSIGIALVTPAYAEAEEIVRDADLAMYQAKAAGKARHAFAGSGSAAGSATIQPWHASSPRDRKNV